MYYLGIDLGGTNIAAGVVDGDYKIVKKGSVPTLASRDGEEIIKDMASLCKRLLVLLWQPARALQLFLLSHARKAQLSGMVTSKVPIRLLSQSSILQLQETGVQLLQ